MRVQLGVSTYVQLVFAASQGPMLMSICMHMYLELYTYTHAQLNHDLYSNIYTVHTYIYIYIQIHKAMQSSRTMPRGSQNIKPAPGSCTSSTARKTPLAPNERPGGQSCGRNNSSALAM